MNKLEEYRTKIDEIDSQIIALYEKRMAVVKDVITYKLENNLPIVDAKRESKMLEKNLNQIKNAEFKKYYDNVLEGFLIASKMMQKDIVKNED